MIRGEQERAVLRFTLTTSVRVVGDTLEVI